MSKKLKAEDVEKEWQSHVKRRAIEQGVSEHEVIMWGLHYDFKREREDKELKEAQKELRDLQKESEKTLKSILKELKKP